MHDFKQWLTTYFKEKGYNLDHGLRMNDGTVTRPLKSMITVLDRYPDAVKKLMRNQVAGLDVRGKNHTIISNLHKACETQIKRENNQ